MSARSFHAEAQSSQRNHLIDKIDLEREIFSTILVSNMVKRISIAIALSLPGILIALSAKPLILRDLLPIGLVLAFAIPISWLMFGQGESIGALSDDELHLAAKKPFQEINREEEQAVKH